jgi:hypothetical protein
VGGAHRRAPEDGARGWAVDAAVGHDDEKLAVPAVGQSQW